MTWCIPTTRGLHVAGAGGHLDGQYQVQPTHSPPLITGHSALSLSLPRLSEAEPVARGLSLHTANAAVLHLLNLRARCGGLDPPSPWTTRWGGGVWHTSALTTSLAGSTRALGFAQVSLCFVTMRTLGSGCIEPKSPIFTLVTEFDLGWVTHTTSNFFLAPMSKRS